MRKAAILYAIIAVTALCAAALAGCGGGTTKASTPGSGPATTAPSPSTQATAPTSQDVLKYIAHASSLSADEIAAAAEAIRTAKDANTGSIFKATSVKVVDGWAVVAVQETDVPADEAVGFQVYLNKPGTGRWEVVQTGTDLTNADLPGAPPELFK